MSVWVFLDYFKRWPERGSSKREREPRTLTIEEFRRFIEHVTEPFRTMCIVTACLGLRVSETLGLKWGDFDWDDLRVKSNDHGLLESKTT